MAAWLVDNFFWLAIVLGVLLVGTKVLITRLLKKLMDESVTD